MTRTINDVGKVRDVLRARHAAGPFHHHPPRRGRAWPIEDVKVPVEPSKRREP
jgi:hypothetical protein